MGGWEGGGERKSKRMNTYFDPHSSPNIFSPIKWALILGYSSIEAVFYAKILAKYLVV